MRKLKILINAYACSPNRGSEQGLAWNWCTNLAKHSELFIITEGEYKDDIEFEKNKFKYKNNLHFYYIPVAPKVKKMEKNQGDWRFYYYYEKWQRKALKLAKDIVKENDIDILHQLNMIGFREPGYLWKINDIPFVWGPIGGMHQFPLAYLQGASIKTKLFFRLKRVLNIIQLKYSTRVDKAINKADLLISATPDSYKAIKMHKSKESIHIPETGCIADNIEYLNERFNRDKLQIVWVGKFDFGKQLHVALKTIAKTQNKKIILNIYGRGNSKQEKSARVLVDNLKISNQVIFHGFLTNSKIQQIMRISDVFFFTSISEGTSTVIMEALSNHLPVLCHNACGFGAIINKNVGIKIELTNPENSVKEFANHLNYLHKNRKVLETFSKNCEVHKKTFLWESYAEQLTGHYHKIISS